MISFAIYGCGPKMPSTLYQAPAPRRGSMNKASKTCTDHTVSSKGPDTSDAWHRTPRKILHPMPRKSENRDLQISGNLNFRRFGSPGIRISGFPDSRKSAFSEIGFLKVRKTRKSGFSDVPIFRFSPKPKNPVKGIGCRICPCGISL